MKHVHRARRHSPLAVRLTIAMTAMVVVVVAVVTLLSIRREEQSYRHELENQASVMLHALESVTADRIDRLEGNAVPALLLELAERRVVISARVYDIDGRIVGDLHNPGLTRQKPADPAGLRLVVSEGNLFEWKQDGTGLGLALSKHLAETMGGRIGVASVVGQGSSFWVELPLASSSSAPAGPVDDPTSSATAVPAGTSPLRPVH